MRTMGVLITLLWILSPLPVRGEAGDLDPTFGTNGIVITEVSSSDDRAMATAIQPDGKILVAGYYYGPTDRDFVLARYWPDGALEGAVIAGFNPGLDDWAHAIAIQPDGKILLAGEAHNGTDWDTAMIRFNSNGTVDTTFGTNGRVITDFSGYDDGAGSVLVTADNRIILVGYTVTGGNDWDVAIARYTSAGALDTSFGSDGKVIADIAGTHDHLDNAALQSDGKIIVAGYAGSDPADLQFAAARFDSSGSRDTTFGGTGSVRINLGTGNDFGNAVAIQPDGKILVGGSANSAAPRFALVRLNQDGNLDNTFDSDGMVTTVLNDSSEINDIALQGDGKIVALGSAGDDAIVARYDSSGRLDSAFGGNYGIDGIASTNFGLSADPKAVAIQSDGKIVIAVQTAVLGTHDFGLARFLGDLALTCTYSDDFEDDVRPADWTYTKPEWTESGGNLIGTPTGRKAEAIATPAYAGCSTCSFETTMSTAGGTMNKVWMLAWYAGKANTIELLMKEENNKWVMKQKVGGRVAVKAAAPSPIEPDTFYTVRVTFDGTNFTLDVDGTTVATMPAAVAPNGTAGFRVKNTTGSFGSICVAGP